MKPHPKMWDEEEKTDRKSLSIKHEAGIAKRTGLKQTKGSGNQPWPSMKGDFSHHLFVFEAKRDKRDKIEVKAAVLDKLVAEACAQGKDPALIITMDGLPSHLPKDWIAVPEEVFMALLGAMEEYYGKRQ